MRNLLFVLSLVLFSQFAQAADLKFAKKKIQIGGVSLQVEIADSPEKAAQGLMFRKKLDEGTGMLFIFPDQNYRTFWMKNTFIPLSIGFFNQEKVLVEMMDMEPVQSEMETNPKTYPSRKPAQYALEVPLGWFQKNKIKTGAKLTGL